MDLREYFEKELLLEEGQIDKIYREIRVRQLSLVQTKVADYEKLFGMSKTEGGGVIAKCPSLLNFATWDSGEPTSVPEKIKFYKSALSADDNDITSMVNKWVKFLTNDIKVAQAKIDGLLKSGITCQQIVDDPRYLDLPLDSLKLRVILCQNYFGEVKAANLIQNERKTYARARYNLENGFGKNGIFRDGKQFEKRYHIADEQLLKRYPLTRQAAISEQNKYNQSAENQLILTETELAQYPLEEEDA